MAKTIILIRKFLCLTVFLLCTLLPTTSTESDRNAITTVFEYFPVNRMGIYKYAFGTSNGINVQTAGGNGGKSFGIFSYTSPEGIPIHLQYIADELGFHAIGEHLPKPYPIPDYVLRSIKYIENHMNKNVSEK